MVLLSFPSHTTKQESFLLHQPPAQCQLLGQTCGSPHGTSQTDLSCRASSMCVVWGPETRSVGGRKRQMEVGHELHQHFLVDRQENYSFLLACTVTSPLLTLRCRRRRPVQCCDKIQLWCIRDVLAEMVSRLIPGESTERGDVFYEPCPCDW